MVLTSSPCLDYGFAPHIWAISATYDTDNSKFQTMNYHRFLFDKSRLKFSSFTNFNFLYKKQQSLLSLSGVYDESEKDTLRLVDKILIFFPKASNFTFSRWWNSPTIVCWKTHKFQVPLSYHTSRGSILAHSKTVSVSYMVGWLQEFARFWTLQKLH